jgi:hypothetical protein
MAPGGRRTAPPGCRSRSQPIPHAWRAGPAPAIPPVHDNRDRLTRRQLCDSGGARDPVVDFHHAHWVLVYEDRRHPGLRTPELPDLLVHLPTVCTGRPTWRESQLARIDLPNRLAHSVRIRCSDASHNPRQSLAVQADGPGVASHVGSPGPCRRTIRGFRRHGPIARNRRAPRRLTSPSTILPCTRRAAQEGRSCPPAVAVGLRPDSVNLRDVAFWLRLVQ